MAIGNTSLPKALEDLLNLKFETNRVINNLTTTEGGFALDARQGKILQDQITSLDAKVDDITGGGYLPLSGGTIKGPLHVTGSTGSDGIKMTVDGSNINLFNRLMAKDISAKSLELTGHLYVGSGPGTGGETVFWNGMEVYEKTKFHSNMSLLLGLSVSGLATLGRINVSGSSTFNSTVTVKAKLDITGSTNLGNTLHTRNIRPKETEAFSIGTDELLYNTVWVNYIKSKNVDLLATVVGPTVLTLYASSWSGTGPYTLNAAMSGVTAADSHLHVFPILPSSSTDRDTYVKAYSCLSVADTYAGGIKFTCYDNKPTTNFQVRVEGVR